MTPIDDEENPAETEDAGGKADGPAGYRLRRAPRYRAFGFTGVLLGVIVGAVLALSFEVTDNYSERTILGYFVAIFGLLGALAGCGVAVLLDRRKD
ncbi:hypothetical protein GCM10027456_10500 [Kineosporia babensis]